MPEITTGETVLSQGDVVAFSAGGATLPESEMLLNPERMYHRSFGSWRLEFDPEVAHRINQSEWFTPTVEALFAKLQLPPGWDSYGARAINRQHVETAINVLLEIMSPDTEAPWVVPTFDGGIQLEWHRESVDLEVEIGGAREVTMYFSDQSSDEHQERSLDEDLTYLREVLMRWFTH